MKNLGSSIYHGREHEEEEDSKVEATQAHWGASKLVESLESIERVLQLEPRHFGALSGRGLVLASLGRYKESIQSFQQAKEVHPFLRGTDENIQRIQQIMQ